MIAIEQADYVSDYILRLKFSDGKAVEVDFEPFLRASRNPHISQYLDLPSPLRTSIRVNAASMSLG